MTTASPTAKDCGIVRCVCGKFLCFECGEVMVLLDKSRDKDDFSNYACPDCDPVATAVVDPLKGTIWADKAA